MVSATLARLIFFGWRYFSLLFVAYLLDDGATGFLLAVAIVELFRIVFDYGLENSVLARLHQRDAPGAQDFARGKAYFRVLATLLGQLVTSGVIAALCLSNEITLAMPLVASVQFSFLMGFGYFQAHLQTAASQGMAVLIRPLAIGLLLQGTLLSLAYHQMIPIWLCAIFFEGFALIVSAVAARRFGCEALECHGKSDTCLPAPEFEALRGVLRRIAPLGNVALIGVAYARIDALAVSLVATGALLTQYLVYQRLASAPLMFFSTIASVSIARLSARAFDARELFKCIASTRRRAYIAAIASGAALAVSGPIIARLFAIENLDLSLLGLQSLVLTLQISNGFHAAFLIALHESSRLWGIARNNTLLAVLVMPASAWILGAAGVALALCMVELFCAAQYQRVFREKPSRHAQAC